MRERMNERSHHHDLSNAKTPKLSQERNSMLGIEKRRQTAGQSNEDTSMKKLCLAAVSAVAVLGVASFANAQGTGTSSGSGSTSASNQCWDVSANMARDRSAASGSSSGST